MKKIFTIVFLTSVAYHSLWHLFHYMGWHWHTSYNIPGFFMLMFSWPWSLFIIESQFQSFLEAILGQQSRFIVSAVLHSSALTINTIVVFLIAKIFRSNNKIKIT